VPPHSSAVLCIQHLDGNRRGLLAQVAGRDLEGIVAKWRAAPYRPDVAPLSWIKIKNPEYSQARDRDEVFTGSQILSEAPDLSGSLCRFAI